jgi:ABC-type multidrug transport system ATPase subunit
MATLTIKSLSKAYGQPVLTDVSFAVSSGHICGLLGVNGAGKSTLFKIICGLVKADAGEVLLDGAPLKRGSYGFMIENPSFDEDLTGYQNLYALSLLFDGITSERIRNLLLAVGLEKKKDERVKTYSLGMKQRLYFAYAIMALPKVLFLDEPFNGLDPLSVRDIENLLLSFAKAGGIVLISSHMIGEIEHFCDSVVILDHGVLTYQNDDLKAVDLRQVFFDSISNSGTVQ